ncbi:UDP-galactopyranose mutase [Moorella sp. E306M]|jgi:UDP-galactopyranose mutase|uniref:UDP-galactopyranose mutase n=1 Tax=Moorella sp. E306M TaxID=2572683 RepID=UPI0010FFAEF8|nr:UDP-galactopyranose mutase [Moorella sp. E306M]GEA17239.1 UDP-galactopyranose mutase [Moorella sp. E306M]
MKIDWVIVGAGFAGATLAERIATHLDKKVLVVEKRDHIGGNAYDEYDESGILVHRYGPHIFHTNLKHVWDYLSRFTRWRPYYHRVLAVVDGKKVPVPFNLNSLYALFPPGQAARLEEALIDEYGFGARVPILKLRESEKKDLRFLADYIYEKIFYGYTLKQWGLKPEELDPSVTGRVPVYISRDDRYFQDKYQAIPEHGYNQLFRRMLAHPNINVLLNTDYREIENEVKFSRMVYTGPIDAFFDYVYGKLPYRSLRFEFATLDREWFQDVGTVNYPNEFDFTRITEFKHLTGQEYSGTSIMREYPYADGDPYYPIPCPENEALYKQYRLLAEKESNITFVGRLAQYRYYNMDQVVDVALKTAEEILRGI